MQVTETLNDGLKREFKVVITAKDINDKLENRLQELGGQVNVPGFRPGKVPVQVLKQRFGPSMARTDEQETFALLVDAEVGGTAPVAEILTRAGHAEAFLASYRKRLADSQLSQLN